MVESAGKRIKVLIVEDDRINQMVIRKMLELRGISSVCASSGFEALEKYENDEFDLVIMDIQLPGMDGIETTERIREIQRDSFKAVPVIALSAYAVENTREYFISAGFDDYAAKPVDYDLLAGLIKKYTFSRED